MITTQFAQTFATGIHYEIIDGVIRPCTIKQFMVTVVAGAVDAALVAAVSSKKLRLLWLNIKAHTADSDFSIGSKPAGASTAIFQDWAIFKQKNTWTLTPEGIVESSVGEGLSYTNGAGGEVRVQGRYIEFTPAP